MKFYDEAGKYHRSNRNQMIKEKFYILYVHFECKLFALQIFDQTVFGSLTEMHSNRKIPMFAD